MNKVYQVHASKNREKFIEELRTDLGLPAGVNVIYRMVKWFSLHTDHIPELNDMEELM